MVLSRGRPCKKQDLTPVSPPGVPHRVTPGLTPAPYGSSALGP